MKTNKTISVIIGFMLVLWAALVLAPADSGVASAQENTVQTVYVVEISGVINPVASEIIGKSIQIANDMNAEAIVIELDTPGGLMQSMRGIIKDMAASRVPVVVFVSPSGGRAGSAGAFITIAAHIAAMAPQTNIGSAHPVNMGGQKMDETMSEKITNDAAAFMRSLATKHNRNAEWAEKAVRDSVSITEQEALELNVIDLIARDLDALLLAIDGTEVETASGMRTLHTDTVKVIRHKLTLRHKILDRISDPNIAYLLMMLGFYGLFFELTNPGAIFPGVFGSIALILAFYAMQTLPVNYAGLLLILLAVILFIVETQVPSFGVLTIGGVIAMTFGSIMLFEAGGPFFRLSLAVVIPTVGLTALFIVLVLGLVMKAHRRKPTTGNEGLIGLEGTVIVSLIKNDGMVAIHGERWSAHAQDQIDKGEKIIVTSVNGLKVEVKKHSA